MKTLPTIHRKYYAYDIEVFPNYFGVTVKHLASQTVRIWRVYGEQSDLTEVVSFFKNRERWFVGYNSIKYDDQLINYIIENIRGLVKLSPEKQANLLFKQSGKIINEEDFEYSRRNYFRTIDLSLVIQAGLIFPKSLKLVAVNLKWPLIQDLPFDIHHQVQPDEVELLEKYNLNDVDITEELMYDINEMKSDKVGALDMRAKISNQYKIPVYTESESGIGNRLFEKMYEDVTGIPRAVFKKNQVYDSFVALDKVIHPKIRFSTPRLKRFLDELRRTVFEVGSKEEFNIGIGETKYTLAQGGLHSVHKKASTWKASGDTRLIDVDVSSFYPRIIVNFEVKPRHLRREFFSLMEKVMNERLEAKATGDTTTADALKITVNAIFGKMGFKYSWLYDPQALLGVTINGQLALLMLIERLEENGIPVFYANTDGITAVIENDEMRLLHEQICIAWMRYTGFTLEFDHFDSFFILNVNNYLVVKTSGKLKTKGTMSKDLYKDLNKGFKYPIVATAVEDFLVNGVPVEKTIRECTDPLEFCMAQKVGREMTVWETYIEDGYQKERQVQKTNRYLVCRPGTGSVLIKKKEGGYTNKLIAGQDVLIMNDVKAVYAEYGGPQNLPIYHSYYITEAMKIVKQLEQRQYDLFSSI